MDAVAGGAEAEDGSAGEVFAEEEAGDGTSVTETSSADPVEADASTPGFGEGTETDSELEPEPEPNPEPNPAPDPEPAPDPGPDGGGGDEEETVEVSIGGSVTLEDGELDDWEFRFRIRDRDDHSIHYFWMDVESGADGSFSFPLVFEESMLGDAPSRTFRYEVVALSPWDAIDYDSRYFDVNVTLSRDAVTGGLSAAVDYVDGSIVFRHRVALSVSVSISGKVRLEGDHPWDSVPSFNFYLETTDGHVPLLEHTYSDLNGDFTFDLELYDYYLEEYMDSDESRLVVYQDDYGPSPEDGYVLDETRFYLTLTLARVDGGLSATVTPEYEGGIEFVNTWRGTYVLIDGEVKTPDGGMDEELFWFRLHAEDEGYPGDQYSTAIVGHGQFAIDRLVFTRDDLGGQTSKDFRYTVVQEPDEGSEANPDIIYDESVFGVTVTVTVHDDLTMSAEVKYDQPIVFVNRLRSPESTATVTVTGSKTLSGRELHAGEFEFGIRAVGGAPLRVGSDTVSNAADGSFSLGPLAFTSGDLADGETGAAFVYEVFEIPGTDRTVTYDGRVYTVRIVLTRDEDGTLSAEVRSGRILFESMTNNPELGAVFTTSVMGSKILENGDLKGGDFEFRLTSTDNPVGPGNGLTVRNDAQGNFTFGPIGFKESDLGGQNSREFHYTVSEVQGTDTSITYDKTVYEVTITVTREGEGLRIDTVVTDGPIKFVNSGPPPVTPPTPGPDEPETTVTIPGVKTLDGKAPAAGRFRFTLTADRKGAPGDGLTVSNRADGSFLFGPIRYTKADLDGPGPWTFDYTVHEIDDGQEGVAYDKAAYRVHVTVTPNADGTLTAVPSIEGGRIAFENTTTPEGPGPETEVTIPGVKRLEGRDLRDGEFRFAITARGDAPLPGDVVVSNRADGMFLFGPIRYTKADLNGLGSRTFVYEIREIAGADPTVAYDGRVFVVRVTVTLEGDGLSHTFTVDNAGMVAFDNTVKPDQPDQPDQPETPDKPNQPDTPDTPGTPGQPGKPSAPSSPGTPTARTGAAVTAVALMSVVLLTAGIAVGLARRRLA